jgi:hypothetical protein
MRVYPAIAISPIALRLGGVVYTIKKQWWLLIRCFQDYEASKHKGGNRGLVSHAPETNPELPCDARGLTRAKHLGV